MMLTLQLHLQKETSTAFSLSSMNNNLFHMMTCESTVTTQVVKGINKTTEATDAHFSAPRCLFSGP